MHPRTIATLEKLERANWFANVGIQDTQTAIVLSSWQDAIVHCSSIEWKNLCLEAANQYRERLLEHSKQRFEQWNEIVVSLKPTIIPFVQRKIESVKRENNLPDVFEHTVQWDILHVCMEAEYADVFQPGYYASQAYWYIKGHFPCGWQGDFPNGRIIIF